MTAPKMVNVEISQEQYNKDIRAAKTQALREQAERMDDWHAGAMTGDAWDNGYLHAVEQILDRADELERG